MSPIIISQESLRVLHLLQEEQRTVRTHVSEGNSRSRLLACP